jgi:hypothetical protein
VFDRIIHSLTVISHKLMSAIEYSRIRGETREELIPRLLKALPQVKKTKRHKRALKPVIKEASKIIKKGTEFEVKAFIPENEWQIMVTNYMNDYIPSNRGPESIYDVDYDVPEVSAGTAAVVTVERYGWDLEREMANNFVSSVRSGQNEAANQNGIVDFSIIAIIDDHTCDECCGDYGCIDFDGKTTKEVEEMTEGEQSAPPFHFNCRCSMAPMLDNMPDLEQSNEEEFNQWLNS